MTKLENHITSKEGRLTYFDIAKGIGIFLVVVGHSIPDAASSAGISVQGYRVLHDIIYSFHMPLFFFIAGYMMSREKMLARGQNGFDIIRKRVSRLLIPYFFVGLLYAPFKVLLANFSNRPYDISGLWMIFIGVNPDGELWFLYSLFVVTCIVSLLGLRISKLGLMITAVFTISSIVWPMVFNYLFFLMFGIYVRKNTPKFIERISVKYVVLCCAIFIVCNYLTISLKMTGLFIITAISGIVITLWISYRLSLKKSWLIAKLETWGIFSMDIYILSDIIKIPFRIILWNKMHCYTLSFVVCIVMGVALSLWISKNVIRENKYLKRCILGE